MSEVKGEAREARLAAVALNEAYQDIKGYLKPKNCFCLEDDICDRCFVLQILTRYESRGDSSQSGYSGGGQWVKIVSESDLPKEDGKPFVFHMRGDDELYDVLYWFTEQFQPRGRYLIAHYDRYAAIPSYTETPARDVPEGEEGRND